jgi:glycosyltransferase involved in cell wall biosynthesis
MLEANACGVPIAAFPVTGPIDVVRNGETGILDSDLRAACLAALRLNSDDCIRYAQSCSWERCARTVLDSLAPIERPTPAPARQTRERQATLAAVS